MGLKYDSRVNVCRGSEPDSLPRSLEHFCRRVLDVLEPFVSAQFSQGASSITFYHQQPVETVLPTALDAAPCLVFGQRTITFHPEVFLVETSVVGDKKKKKQ